ncbi:MAG: SDR family NAD(P)-dependent oxidoreductase, partial [Spirochaetales bacterium]|nr:SDR family NAD(P)-dependent oxidoreductase [Spirochaetales bacterium]
MNNYIEEQFSLKGRLAWVTGAVYGIGFAIASAYAKAGCSIAINTNNPEHLEKGLQAYKDAGITDVRGYLSDVTNEDEVKATVAAIEKDFGRKIDILVNNAGIIKRIPMIEMS